MSGGGARSCPAHTYLSRFLSVPPGLARLFPLGAEDVPATGRLPAKTAVFAEDVPSFGTSSALRGAKEAGRREGKPFAPGHLVLSSKWGVYEDESRKNAVSSSTRGCFEDGVLPFL